MHNISIISASHIPSILNEHDGPLSSLPTTHTISLLLLVESIGVMNDNEDNRYVKFPSISDAV